MMHPADLAVNSKRMLGKRTFGKGKTLQNLTPAGAKRVLGGLARSQGAKHPTLVALEGYRLEASARWDVVKELLRDNVDCWWERYKDYKEKQAEFPTQWSQWLVATAALGPFNREAWPPLPPIPTY